MKAAWVSYWRSRSPRERRLLGIGMTLVALTLLYFYAIRPVNLERARLRAAMPQLRADAASVRADGIEVAQLKPLAASAATVDARSVLLDSATAFQIDPASVTVQTNPSGPARLTISRVAFDSLMRYVDAAQSIHHLRLESAVLRALNEPGMVSVEAEFASPTHLQQ